MNVMVLVLSAPAHTSQTPYVDLFNLYIGTNLIRGQGVTNHTLVVIPNYRVGKGW